MVGELLSQNLKGLEGFFIRKRQIFFGKVLLTKGGGKNNLGSNAVLWRVLWACGRGQQ